MNIALIGSPGSGKTELAAALSNELPNSKIVDGYAEAVEKRTDISISPLSSYIGNLMVVLERHAEENLARRDSEYVITCGTLIETAVYLAMNFTGQMDSFSDEEKEMAGPRIEAVLRMMAVFYQEIFTYDVGFYLPPTRSDEDTLYIDRSLQAALEAFKLVPVTPLLDPDTRVQDALEVLRAQASE